MTTPIPPDQAPAWCDALEALATIHGAFFGLRVLLQHQEEHLDAYELARVAMIIEVVTDRFATLLDTALDGMLALRRPSAQCAPAAAQPEETQL